MTETAPEEATPLQAQVEIRSASSATQVADVDTDQRIITVIAVPYEQPAKVLVRGQVWDEVFSRSAFMGIEKRPQRIRVNREHVRGDTVGKVIAFDPSRAEGLLAEIKIANTLRGNDTLALAKDDCLSASVGYIARPSQVTSDRRSMLRRVNTAWMDHLSLVEAPTWDGASVVDVRNAAGALTGVREPIATPILDDFLTDPIVRRALGLES
jgi:phage head maturation protease